MKFLLSAIISSRAIYVWLYGPFIGPWPLFQFLDIFLQSVGLLGRGISPSQGHYLHTYRITDMHASSGIRTHDPQYSSGRRQFMPYTVWPLWSAQARRRNFENLDTVWVSVASEMFIADFIWATVVAAACCYSKMYNFRERKGILLSSMRRAIYTECPRRKDQYSVKS
jgi:hypothetical protein